VGANELARVRELMVTGHPNRKEERQVLELLRGASAPALNVVVRSMTGAELRELVNGFSDRMVGPDNRTNLLNLFKERQPELTQANQKKLANELHRNTNHLELRPWGAVELGAVRGLKGSGNPDRKQEREILEMLRGASTSAFNGMVGKMSVGELKEMVQGFDDRWVGPDNRSNLLKLLRERQPELSQANQKKLAEALR
jgi:hypothetical protein